MYGIGKLQTLGGLRLPCPLCPLLQVARLTGEIDAPTKAWAAMICCDPSLLIFCVDRFEGQHGMPVDGLKSLALWARFNLADALLPAKVIKRDKRGASGSRKHVSDPRAGLKLWRTANSACDRNKALYLLLKQQWPRNQSACLMKHWLKRSAKQLLRDPKFNTFKKHALSRQIRRSSASNDLSVKTLRSLLLTGLKGLRNEQTFRSRLQTEKLAAMKQLAYGASHEINNPLANIATGTQALMQSETDEGRRHRLANVFQQAMAAHEMISDLMLFAHPPAPELETVDLRVLIAEIINRSDQQGRKVRATFGPGVFQARIDRNQMTVAIEALLRNAFEAIEQMEDRDHEAHVSIRTDVVTENGSGLLRFFVIDNGPGFTHQQSRHMFDPFYSGREAGRGLGFGLSKVYRIVKLHHGEILANRDPRVGETTFLISLPLAGLRLES